jgi:hypothetical protein
MRLRQAHAMLEIKAALEALEWPFQIHCADLGELDVHLDDDFLHGSVEILDPSDSDRCLRTYYLNVSAGPGEYDVTVLLELDADMDNPLYSVALTVWPPEDESLDPGALDTEGTGEGVAEDVDKAIRAIEGCS